MTTLTYTYARQNLAEVLSGVENTQEPAIIRRKGHEDVAIVPAAELASLLETAHLLRSPANASRLRAALERSLRGETVVRDVETLRREFKLEAHSPARPRRAPKARRRSEP